MQFEKLHITKILVVCSVFHTCLHILLPFILRTPYSSYQVRTENWNVLKDRYWWKNSKWIWLILADEKRILIPRDWVHETYPWNVSFSLLTIVANGCSIPRVLPSSRFDRNTRLVLYLFSSMYTIDRYGGKRKLSSRWSFPNIQDGLA